MKRVMLLIRRLWNGGGTETYVLTLATELKRQGYEVGVMTTGGPWTALLQKRGIRVYVDPSYRANTLRQLVVSHGYQVVHANDSSSFSLVRRAGLKHGVCVIFTVHGRYVHPSILTRSAAVAKAVITVSPSMYDYVTRIGVPAKKVHLVSNGIATDIFRPGTDHTLRQRYRIPLNAFVVGYAGRFTFDKRLMGMRITNVLRAYAESHPNVHILVAGRNSKASVRPSARVHVIGHGANMARFYRNCNLMVGTGRVALESLACGIPTIATGYARYIGIVTQSKLPIAFSTNFGDHGARRQLWLNAQLNNDVERVIKNAQPERIRANAVSRIVRERYSAVRMTTRLRGLYG